jgi:hypothetical protein
LIPSIQAKREARKAFEPFFCAEKDKSKLDFHGTSLSNLRSILTTSFFTKQNLHLTKEPANCYGYAFKVPKEGDEINGENTPFTGYDVVLVCGVAGSPDVSNVNDPRCAFV